MAAEELHDLHLSDSSLSQPSPAPHPHVLRLQHLLIACSKPIEDEDFHQSQSSLSELVDFLDSIADVLPSVSCDEDPTFSALELLSDIYRYISSPSLGQEVLDALSFELPKAVAKFSSADHGRMEMIDRIIQLFIERCSPRDMISILCEALDSPTKASEVPSYFNHILKGLSNVLPSIQRRHFVHVKVAVPVIIKCLKAVLESDHGDSDTDALFSRAIEIGSSIHAICLKLVGESNKKLCALLCLYMLQIMALVSVSMGEKISNSIPFVSQISRFLPYCGSSFLGFITGSDIEKFSGIVIEGAEGGSMNCFSDIELGAALTVVWGHISVEVAQAAGENLNVVIDELRSDQTKRWQTVGLLKHTLSFFSLPWELKKYSVNFLDKVMDDHTPQSDPHTEFSSYMPSLFAGLQAFQMVIVYASDAPLRKNAFDVFKKVLADIPISSRFEILKVLITNCKFSSMTAILLDRVREGLQMDKNRVLREEHKVVLELVEFVLRPPKGGPPCLPEQSDAVLSALNLYRFVLIKESVRESKETEVRCRRNLLKAYNEWLLPLRTLVTGIMAGSSVGEKRVDADIVCALNPVELVLFRCIELTEEELKRHSVIGD